MKNIKCPLCGGKSIETISGFFDDRYGSPGYYDVRMCRQCGYGRTTPNITDSEIANFYSKYYPLRKINSQQVIRQIDRRSRFIRWLTGTDNVSHLYIKKNKKILDVGSASGVSLLEINERGSQGFGVEPDPHGAKLAKELNLTVFPGTLFDNPFPQKKFDYITASQVLEHVSDPKKFLDIARNKLFRSGKIIISVPINDSLWKKIFGKKWINWHIPYHVSHFSRKSIYLLAEKANLKITDIKTVTPNIWTVYQIMTALKSSKYGKPTSLWTGKYSYTILKKVNGYLIQILFIVVTPICRLIDFIGMGDSALIIMKKNGQ